MKLKHMMEKVAAFLDADTKTQQQEICSMRKILKELKQKERKLKDKLKKKLPKDEYTEIKIKLEVLYAQRKKGVEKVKQLRRQARD